MALPAQRLVPALLEPAYHREKAALLSRNALGQLWAGDTSLWQAEAAQAKTIQNCLAWLHFGERMRPELPRIAEFVAGLHQEGLTDVVLLGTGGSSAAGDVFTQLFPPAPSGKRFILDSTDPATIRTVERDLNLRRTLFLVASKPGTTTETLCHFLYFLEQLKRQGVSSPGRHFAAVTDSGSYLAELAVQYRFRATFQNPPATGSWHSALSLFGLVPAALWGVDVPALLAAAEEMREACRPSAAPDANPALALAAWMGAGALEGRDKLFVLSAPGLDALSRWIEQLVAVGTGKKGRGIIPVAGELPPTPEVFSSDCMIAVLRRGRESNAELERTLEGCQQRSVPLIEIALKDEIGIGAELFKWELATALAGTILQVNPFETPDAQGSRLRTRQLLEQLDENGELAASAVRLSEARIELGVEGATRHQISTLSLREALRSFFELCRPNDYVALLAFLDRNLVHSETLQRIRGQIANVLQLPVSLSFGPSYLHSTGQLYKGGPPTGLFLVLTAEHSDDVPVPGASYTFGQLELAQALGDLDSLRRRGRHVLRLHLTEGASGGLGQLEGILQQSLAHVRTSNA